MTRTKANDAWVYRILEDGTIFALIVKTPKPRLRSRLHRIPDCWYTVDSPKAIEQQLSDDEPYESSRFGLPEHQEQSSTGEEAYVCFRRSVSLPEDDAD